MRLSVGAGSRFFVSVEPFKLFASGKLFKLLACHAGLLSGSLAVIILYNLVQVYSIGGMNKLVQVYMCNFVLIQVFALWYTNYSKKLY